MQELPFLYDEKAVPSQVEVKSRKTKENGIPHLRENGPHSCRRGKSLHQNQPSEGVSGKLLKIGEHKSPPERTFIWRLAQFELEINNVMFPTFLAIFWDTLYSSLI